MIEEMAPGGKVEVEACVECVGYAAFFGGGSTDVW